MQIKSYQTVLYTSDHGLSFTVTRWSARSTPRSGLQVRDLTDVRVMTLHRLWLAVAANGDISNLLITFIAIIANIHLHDKFCPMSKVGPTHTLLSTLSEISVIDFISNRRRSKHSIGSHKSRVPCFILYVCCGLWHIPSSQWRSTLKNPHSAQNSLSNYGWRKRLVDSAARLWHWHDQK